MAKIKIHFRCSECGADHLRWSGKCSSCGLWNTLIEAETQERPSPSAGTRRRLAVPTVTDSRDLIGSGAVKPIRTGSFEFDRALGGGVMPGSVMLVGGEPGIGKSTLLSQFAVSVSNAGLRCLYISAEESQSQVGDRISRVGGMVASVGVLVASMMGDIEGQIDSFQPDAVIVDSVQTVYDPELTSSAGSVNQVRECTMRLSDLAKSAGFALLLVGHVTKDGNLAGPRSLEHLVDTVAYFEGDRDSSLRILRVVKHRFGPVGDLGMFEMGAEGLMDLDNATGIHLSDRVVGQSGSVVFPSLDGRRVMLTEIQALVVPTSGDQPRRVATGFDLNRVLLLIAVLEKKAGIRLFNKDVYVSVTGGMRLSDPSADLAVVAAIVSSLNDRPVDPSAVFLGEIGLGGEIRSASSSRQRASEAARLGFNTGFVGRSFACDIDGFSPHRSTDLRSALAGAGLHFS